MVFLIFSSTTNLLFSMLNGFSASKSEDMDEISSRLWKSMNPAMKMNPVFSFLRFHHTRQWLGGRSGRSGRDGRNGQARAFRHARASGRAIPYQQTTQPTSSTQPTPPTHSFSCISCFRAFRNVGKWPDTASWIFAKNGKVSLAHGRDWLLNFPCIRFAGDSTEPTTAFYPRGMFP